MATLLALAIVLAATTDESTTHHCQECNLQGAPVSDRGAEHATVDLYYKLHTAPGWWNAAPTPTYTHVMHTLHGKNMWHDPTLQPMLQPCAKLRLTCAASMVSATSFRRSSARMPARPELALCWLPRSVG